MKITGFQFGALAVIIGGVILLTFFDKPTGSYIALITPILAAMYLDGRTEKQNEALATHDQKLDQITHQTNGILTARINDAVAEGVKAAFAEREGSGT
jgi:CII-binding regulator of phage lambda lysogenization HflD